MFKAIFATATATAALIAVSFGSSAYAGGMSGQGGINGISLNGVSLNGWGNGVSLNGWSNGVSLNGWSNGVSINGTAPAAASFAIDGIELPAHVR